MGYYPKNLREKKYKDQKNKQQQSLNVKFIDLLNKDWKTFLRYLKGDFIISHCKGHNSIILLFDFKLETNHRRFLVQIFFFKWYKKI